MGLIFFAFFEKFFVPILTSGGYVGLSIATLLSQHHHVTAVDIIPEKVEMINNRKSPIQDDYIEKYLAEKDLDLTATLDAKAAYSDADFVVIAAPTNYDSHTQHFDTSAVEAVIKLVMEYNPNAIMVIKSTIPVGYTASVREKFNSKNIIFPEKSAWLYANVSDIKNLVGDELVASAIKSAMAELGPNEVTNRTKIEPLAQQKLAESLVQKYGEDVVFVNKVVVNDMNFEDAYNEAIQQKSIAQQNADKQKIENEAAIAKAEADKQVAITNAEAEAQKTSIAADAQAEANRKLAESLSDTLIDYQKIQKWDGKGSTYFT